MFGRIVIGALLTIAIALLGILPPILHFITGPLGPLIGGLFAGYRIKARLLEAIGMALLVSIIIIVPSTIILKMIGGDQRSSSSASFILFGVAAYFGVMTMLGALAGGAIALRR